MADKPVATELEGVILGVISGREPCTSYVVLRRFQRSPTWGWSSSKGAIYSAVARLVECGWLQATRAADDGRNTELLSLTDAGRDQLRGWIMGIRPEMGGAPLDPVRARMNYLDNLSVKERERFLDSAEEVARAALEAVAQWEADPQSSSTWALEACRVGARMQIEAKILWLRQVREELLRPDRPRTKR